MIKDRMTLSEIMVIRHSCKFEGHFLNNGGIYFNMTDFFKTVNDCGRKLPVKEWTKIEVIDE